jgi:hypothetical protein
VEGLRQVWHEGLEWGPEARFQGGGGRARPLPTWFFALRADHARSGPLHAPDQQARQGPSLQYGPVGPGGRLRGHPLQKARASNKGPSLRYGPDGARRPAGGHPDGRLPKAWVAAPSLTCRPRVLSDSQVTTLLFKLLRTGCKWHEVECGKASFMAVYRRLLLWERKGVIESRDVLQMAE